VARSKTHHLAYVFERFPTATQTFCVREILELERLGLQLRIFSIRDTSDEQVCNAPEELRAKVTTLPQGKDLTEAVKVLKSEGRLPKSVVLTLRHWGDRPDKQRVYEAAWIGHQLSLETPRILHAHCHFAGVAARTLWWLRKFHHLTYSVTGHANDLFCDPGEVFPKHPQLLEGASVVPTVSQFTANWIARHLPRAASRTVVAYNGLDLRPFDAKAAGIGVDPPLVLSVGRLIEKKGFPDLIEACGILRDQGMDLRCRIIGDGPMEDELERQIENRALRGVVELAGALPVEEITRQLEEDTALFALPCMVERDGGMDNLPTVIMEAMAAGLPVVSTRLAGVPEMIEEGVTGRLVEPGDVTALMEAMRGYLEDPERSRREGRAARAKCLSTFSSEVTARHLLRTLVARGRTRIDGRISEHLQWGDRIGNWGVHLSEKLCFPPKVRDKGFDLGRFMSS